MTAHQTRPCRRKNDPQSRRRPIDWLPKSNGLVAATIGQTTKVTVEKRTEKGRTRAMNKLFKKKKKKNSPILLKTHTNTLPH